MQVAQHCWLCRGPKVLLNLHYAHGWTVLALSGINSQLSFSKCFVPVHSSIAVTSWVLTCPLPIPSPELGCIKYAHFFPVSFAISARLLIQGAAPHTSVLPSSKEETAGSHHPYPQLEEMFKEGRMLTRTQTLIEERHCRQSWESLACSSGTCTKQLWQHICGYHCCKSKQN